MPMLQFWFCGVQSPNYVSLITATTRRRCKNGLRTKLSKTSTLGWLGRVIFALSQNRTAKSMASA
jgi:hypothetical protein